MKFVLFVEGATEQKAVPRFLKRWLDSKLVNPVGIKPVRFHGWPEMRKEMPKKARMYLDGSRPTDIVAVIGLMDLYGPTFYPAELASVAERLNWARGELEKNVGLGRFRMFFAIHEVEAWLLSQPQLFPPEVRRAIEKANKHPEDVNFGCPPSKLLGELYLKNTDRTYKKVAYGSQLFNRLDPKLAADQCPELKRMLECMLQMARDVGC